MNLSEYAIGGATRPDALTGFNPDFSAALEKMLMSAPPEIRAQLKIASGYRSPQIQADLYKKAVAQYGSEDAARHWVAPPGKSQHNHGMAADLRYLDPAALDWAHKNAGTYGLAFPLANENWHVELQGARGGKPSGLSDMYAPTPAPNGLGDAPSIAAAGANMTGAAAAAPQAVNAIGMLFAQQQEQKQREQDQQDAENVKRAALFNAPSLAALYA